MTYVRASVLFAASALAGAMSLVSFAVGQPGGSAAAPQRPVLKALDLNGDGVLSPEEIEAASTSLLKLDRNGDGMLTQDEFLPQPAEAAAAAGDLETRLMAMDRNGDGVLTADEVPERLRGMFERGDTNHDGKLTAEEVRAMVARQGGPQGRPVGRSGAEGLMRMDPLISTLDVDHDGVLTAAEIASAPGALKMLDTNGDGTLDANELRVRQQTPGERAAHVLNEWDTDKNGRLSKAESPDRLQKQFEAVDTNHDGQLSLEELTTFFATQTPGSGRPTPRNDAPGAQELPGASAQTAKPVQP